MWFIAEWASADPPVLLAVVDVFWLLSLPALVNVPGRITNPKRRIQVKNLARRVWMIKSLRLRTRSCASGTLEPGSAGTPAVIVGIAGSSPPFSGSAVVGAGVESEGSSGGFSLVGGVETGAAPLESVTGAEASTLAVALTPLSVCFSCSEELPYQRDKSDCQKRERRKG